LARFLDAGPAPIVFTLGTAAVYDAGRFYHESLAAARRLGERAVLLTGVETRNTEGLNLGNDAIAIDYAPYSELFPRAAVNVHQGGIGTTAQALRAGRPTVIMPYAHDQFDNALRCKRLGISNTLSRERYSAASAASAIRGLIYNRAAARAAQRVALQVRRENGAESACDAIESLLQPALRKYREKKPVPLELPSSALR
jgi:UDP:flavonoid glycosyltransferase YjiC (YdhE family)